MTDPFQKYQKHPITLAIDEVLQKSLEEDPEALPEEERMGFPPLDLIELVQRLEGVKISSDLQETVDDLVGERPKYLARIWTSPEIVGSPYQVKELSLLDLVNRLLNPIQHIQDGGEPLTELT